jgi:hypothetical protein
MSDYCLECREKTDGVDYCRQCGTLRQQIKMNEELNQDWCTKCDGLVDVTTQANGHIVCTKCGKHMTSHLPHNKNGEPIINWGGKRDGAGRKSSWKMGPTKPIKIPDSIADEVMRYARHLDQGGQTFDNGTEINNLNEDWLHKDERARELRKQVKTAFDITYETLNWMIDTKKGAPRDKVRQILNALDPEREWLKN